MPRFAPVTRTTEPSIATASARGGGVAADAGSGAGGAATNSKGCFVDGAVELDVLR